MDAKELNKTTTKLYERLRELSQEKLSRPIPVKRKTGDEKSIGFGISNYRDLLWFPVGTPLYADNDYFMKKSTETWLSSNKYYSSEELFNLLLEASKNEVRLYATSTDTIVKELQK